MSSAGSVDRGSVDAHDHEFEETGRGSGLDEEFKCTICGLTVTPRQGVKDARSERRW